MFVTVTNIIYKRINAHGYGDSDYVLVQHKKGRSLEPNNGRPKCQFTIFHTTE